MRVFDIALKDWSQLVRDWKSFGFLLVMPIVFTLMFGFAFGGGGDGGEYDPRLPVGVLDQDGSELSASLLGLIELSEAIRPVEIEDEQELRDQVEDEDLAAGIILPVTYGDGVLSGQTGNLVLLVKGGAIAGTTAQNEVQAAVTRLLGSVQAAELSTQLYEEQQIFADAAARNAFVLAGVNAAIQAWEDPPLTVHSTQSGITNEDAEEEDTVFGDNSYSHPSAGMMIQFAMAGVMGAAEILVLERKSRALQRLLTTATSRFEIILGHYLAMAVMILLQLLLLALFGQLLLKVNYFGEPLAALLVIVPFALWAAAMGLLVGVLAKSEDQVAIFSLIPMFVFSAFGGAWMPLEFTPEAFQKVGHLFPTAWALDGLKDIIIRGQGVEAVLPAAGVVLAYAAAFFALAVWRFKSE